jgi:hypothetical protein
MIDDDEENAITSQELIVALGWADEVRRRSTSV